MYLYSTILNERWDLARKLLSAAPNEKLHRFVMARGNDNRTVLTMRLKRNEPERRFSIQIIPYDIFCRLVEIGGNDLVMARNREDRRTALHYLCLSCHSSRKKVEKLIEIGGDVLLYTPDINGMTALHCSVGEGSCFPSTEVVNCLLENGGNRLAMMRDSDGRSALHLISSSTISHPSSVLFVSYFISYGGWELLFMTDKNRMTALHLACIRPLPDITVVRKLVIRGGVELLKMKDSSERTAYYYVNIGVNELQNDVRRFMLRYIIGNSLDAHV